VYVASPPPESTRRALLESMKPLLLDGGNGHLLRRLGIRVKGQIGSMERFLNVALANRNEPSTVMRAHKAYLDAGATVITTNNYSCVPAALELAESSSRQHTSPEKLIIDLITAAGQLASEVRDNYVVRNGRPRCLVAGCVPPLHESYRPDLVGEDMEVSDGYGLIVPVIAPFSDVLLCETMSSVREGRLAAEAACKAGLPVWVAWTLSEDSAGHLRSGETIEEAVASVSQLSQVEAMLLNCSSPESIHAGLGRLKKSAPIGVRVGAYGNGFRTVRASGGDEDDQSGGGHEYNVHLTPDTYASHTAVWVEHGADIIGGCCGIFPEHIDAVAKRLVI